MLKAKVFKQDLHNLDVTCRHLLRSVVGPPVSMDWSQPWYEVLYTMLKTFSGAVQRVSSRHVVSNMF